MKSIDKMYDKEHKNNDKPKGQPCVFRSVSMSSPLVGDYVSSSVGPRELLQQEEVNTKPMMKEISIITTPTQITHGWETPKLTPMSLYWPVGPHQKRVRLDQLDTILQTLRQIFRELSLVTRYNNSPVAAECRSLDQVTLEVLLFSARDETDKIILEVSRIEGDSYAFHLYASQILSTISGQTKAPAPIISCWNLDLIDQTERLGVVSTGSVEEALEVAWSMLNTERLDAQKLGLESLKQMTNPNNSWSTSKAAAACILNPDGHIQTQISKAVWGYATQSQDTSGGLNAYSNEEAGTDWFNANIMSFKKANDSEFAYLGLVILAQTFLVAARDKTLDIGTFLDVCPVDLVGCIIDKVDNVRERPHEAYYGVQCLSALYDCVPVLRERIKGAHVQEAQMVGEMSHLALATVSEKLLIGLQA